MSLDTKARLEDELARLARRAPTPQHWADLGTPVISLDGKRPRGPRVVTAVVAAAAIVVLVAAAAVIAIGNRGTPEQKAASDPGVVMPPSSAASTTPQSSAASTTVPTPSLDAPAAILEKALPIVERSWGMSFPPGAIATAKAQAQDPATDIEAARSQIDGQMLMVTATHTDQGPFALYAIARSPESAANWSPASDRPLPMSGDATAPVSPAWKRVAEISDPEHVVWVANLATPDGSGSTRIIQVDTAHGALGVQTHAVGPNPGDVWAVAVEVFG